METTLFSSENSDTEKQPFWKKALRFEIKLGPLFRAYSVSKILGSQGPQVMKFYQFYTIPQMNGPQIFVLQKNLKDIHFMINSSAHEFLTI